MEAKAKAQTMKSRRRTASLALMALALVMALGLAYYISASAETEEPIDELGTRDENALKGKLKKGLSDEELQNELNRIVEEGMFHIKIASIVVAQTDGKTQTADFQIENTEFNRYLMQVSVKLDEEDEHGNKQPRGGETIYRSGILEPGYYIESAPLSKALKPGTYQATATFEALYTDDESSVGKAAAKIQLYVMEEGQVLPEGR